MREALAPIPEPEPWQIIELDQLGMEPAELSQALHYERSIANARYFIAHRSDMRRLNVARCPQGWRELAGLYRDVDTTLWLFLEGRRVYDENSPEQNKWISEPPSAIRLATCRKWRPLRWCSSGC